MKGECREFPDELMEEYYFRRLKASEADRLESHLKGCVECRRRWQRVTDEIGFMRSVLAEWAWGGAERRRCVREPATGPVTLVLGRSGRAAERVEGELRDESVGGLGVLSPRRCRPGRLVTVVRGRQALAARVRYCRDLGGRFAIGLQLQTV